MRVMVVGASGYVGGVLVKALLDGGAEVVAPVRRPLAWADERLMASVVDLAAPQLWPCWDGVDCLLLCLGASGGRGYRQIDEGLTLSIAAEAHRRGVRRVQVVSSVGASTRAIAPYLRSKGRMEDALIAMGWDSCLIWQPGPLLGRQPPRWSERLQEPLLKVVAAVSGGRRSPYAGVTAQQLAVAMISHWRLGSGGVMRAGSPAILSAADAG
ncbi:MAG: NAD(P)H-binding protein [Gammaproteobacteria bacterium]|nr:NAD(P)H-binding protein [Gammaproteobacteria bacterium]